MLTTILVATVAVASITTGITAWVTLGMMIDRAREREES